MAAILEDEDVARMEANRVPLRKDPGNADTVDAVITSPRSAGRNLINLSSHSYLSLIFLLRVALLRTIHLLPESSIVVLTHEEYDRL